MIYDRRELSFGELVDIVDMSHGLLDVPETL